MKYEVVSESFQAYLLWQIREGHWRSVFLSLLSQSRLAVVLSTHIQFVHAVLWTCVKTAEQSLLLLTNSSDVPAINFERSSTNLLPWPSKCFFRLLANILKAEHRFLSSTRVSKPVSVCSRWRAFWAASHQNALENVEKNFWTRSWRPLSNNPSILSHGWNQLWILPGVPHGKLEHAWRCWEVCPRALNTRSEVEESWILWDD